MEVSRQRTVSGSTPGFVGRTHEMAELLRLFDDLSNGNGALAMLVGQPGIGKTRTALEFAGQARQRGARVHIGHCHEDSGMPPFWPWRQLVRDLLRADQAETLSELSGDDLAGIAKVVPELASNPNGGSATEAAEVQSRFQVFDAIGRLLAEIARRHPTVLVMENLHLADVASLRLLEFIAPALNQTPLLVIGTYRDIELSRGHPMAGTLGRLTSQPCFRRIRLRGLDEEESSELMQDLTGLSSDPLVQAIHSQTEGNPLFVIQVMRYLKDFGLLNRVQGESLPDSVRVPEGVREVVGQRLNRLSEQCNGLLGIAAVLGRVFDLDELNALGDEYNDPDRSSFLEQAIEAHILEEVPGTRNRLQFTHALIRETLYDEIPATRRIQLHAKAATVIEDARADVIDNHLPRLAHHYFEGQLVTGPEKVIHYADRAAKRASRILAYEEAAKFLALAVDCADISGCRNRPDICQIRMQLGEAQRKGGDAKAAMQTFGQVAQTAELICDVQLFAEAALAFESARWRPGLPADPAVGLLERALDKLPTHDGPLRCRLLGRLARALSYTERDHRAASLAHESVEVARRLDDPRILCGVLDDAVLALRRHPDRAATRLSYCQEQLDIAGQLGAVELAAEAHSTIRGELLEMGELDAFEQAFDEYQSLTRELRQPHYDYQAAFVEVMRSLLAGDFDRVSALAARALGIGGRIEGSDADGVFAMQMFTLHRERGTLERFAPLLRRILDSNDGEAIWSPGLALLYAEIGELTSAQTLLSELASERFDAVRRDELWLTSISFLAEVCAVVGDRPNAERLYSYLLPYRGRNVVFGPCVVCYGPVDRQLGVLATLLGRWTGAFEHFSVALENADRLGSGPCRARVQCDWSAALIRRSTGPALVEANSRLTDAASLAAKHGMSGLERRIDEMQQVGRHRAAAPDDLTRREIDVLRLIAQGCSNRQIADGLSISLPTVATHVRNILAKTGSANRTAAAAYARENEMLDGE